MRPFASQDLMVNLVPGGASGMEVELVVPCTNTDCTTTCTNTNVPRKPGRVVDADYAALEAHLRIALAQ